MSKRSSSIGRAIGIGAGAVAALAVAIQLVPFGRDHAKPPVTLQVNWDSDQTRDLFYRACADCHSNETKWPWYSNVAPVSWLVQRDVNEGREHFNISEMSEEHEGEEHSEGRDDHHHSPAELVRDGQMPMPIYLITHPEARLSDAEKQQLIDGLEATFGGEEGVVAYMLASVP